MSGNQKFTWDYQLNKLLGVFRTFLQVVLDKLARKCAPHESYAEVESLLDCVVDEFREEAQIVEHYGSNKKLFRYLSTKCTKDKEDYQEKLLKCDEKIFDLENEIKEVEVENALKSQLVIKWEQARLEHTDGRFAEQKHTLEMRIQKAKSDYDKELRIYNEIETFTRDEIERLESLAVEWEDRYNRECRDLDEQIKASKLAIETTQDRIQALRETFIRRNIEIQSYLTQKAQLEEQRRVEKLKWDSAVKIQAWWRGTMFRNGLGPYRKKKKAPKKGKKK